MATKKVIKKVIVKTKAEAKTGIKSLSIKKAYTKSEIVQSVAEMVELGKKQAVAVLDALMHIISAHLSKKGPGVFVFPGLVKFRVVHKPATKKRKGKNPFTGEPMIFAAKPAHNVIKVRSLKKIKDIAK